jgi:CCR4-NOT transcriptional regulation complex NOT5 subunit
MTSDIEARLKKLENAIDELKLQIYKLDSRTNEARLERIEARLGPFERIMRPRQLVTFR